MLEHRLFSKCEDVDAAILCSLCQDSWDKPTELQPCGHIFCESCVGEYTASFSRSRSGTTNGNESLALLCPTCGCSVERREDPNRLLVNMALAVSVQCRKCKWKGTREKSWKHICPLPASEEVALGTDSSSCAAKFQRVLDEVLTEFERIKVTRDSNTSVVVSEGGPPGPPSVPEKKWQQYGLSQTEYDHIMSLFIHFDTDSSGFLTRLQMQQLLLSLNYAKCGDDLTRMLSQMDPDESGVVTIHDFCTWLTDHLTNSQAFYGLSQLKYNEVLMQFQSHDVEQKGVLEWEAFRLLCIEHGYAGNEKDAWELFTSFANRSDGTVSLHQFLLFCQRLRGVGEKQTVRPQPQPASTTTAPTTAPGGGGGGATLSEPPLAYTITSSRPAKRRKKRNNCSVM